MKKCTALALAVSVMATSAQAFSEDELVIWLGGDKAYNGLVELGQKFEEDTGIKVSVQNPEDVPGRYQLAASSGQGPDIVFWAHDRMGGWVDAGLIQEVYPSERVKQEFNDKGWDAMTQEGKVYGYPLSLEAIGLLYNKEIVPEPPASFEEMFELNKKLTPKNINTLIWDQPNPYFSAPFFLSNGGYVFKKENGAYNTNDTGMNNAGAKEGGALFTKLLKEGITPRGADFSIAEARFAQNKAAMIIAGPWSWSNFDSVNVDYGVAPLPTIDGVPAKPFVGVWGAMVNKASPNGDIVKEFMEQYVMTLEGIKTINKDVPLGVVAHNEYIKELRKDPRIEASYQSVTNGILMPSVPEMGRFWTAFASALQNIISEREPTNKALDRTADFIVNGS